ncbi:chromosome segregation protein SMC [Dethiobacter alkaliphilus]|uniref:chromosome segregation protein SMC n=1 Tax=Dethiobacter alkaliphilus TaxID=427926 RepID=UPI0022273362|nr:chromosome segregation protein SMC [Dethiobacter alkaliphilus]MCW3489937.1 chromosome segregation protein SMC [Dethiobacter alkaliphilus]
MFVKRLEMHGFKSFGDKTIFDLTPGITVVVGPNGCGKSNITDAVRWVLGEQSARHLRGTRMDDIIFGGTANRKPLSFAEVSITLDHSDGALGLDYQEVTVTRRLYRTGESEYLLNKRPCRLKDILELFMDTGIGKEAYSFIGQGRVDEILNARPEERRQIFEEAAGILKYKTRKREAQRRLAETAENLLRVGDIIHELSGQLEPLSEQADTAQKYLQLRDKLKNREIDVLVHDAEQLRTRWYEVDEKARAAADELLEKQTATGRGENELATKQLALDEEQAAVSAMQKEAQRLGSELEKIQGKSAVTQEKIHGVERQLADGAAYLNDLDDQKEILAQHRVRIENEMAAVNETLKQAKEELINAQKALTDMETSPEAVRSHSGQQELEKLMPMVRQLQTEHDRLELELEQLQETRQNLCVQQEEKAAQTAALNHQGQALLAQKDELLAQKEQLQKQGDALQKQREELTHRSMELSNRQKGQEKELADKKHRLRLLTELEEAMAGFHQGVKSVLAAQKKQQAFPGIQGTVADILQVPSTYVAAVEAALGTALQNLVAEDDGVAKEAIAFLKKSKGGRATFLPLNTLSVQPRRNHPVGLADQSGYIGVAADLVQTEERFTDVAESLLARVHVVENLEAAVPVARMLRFRERVVTVEGDVILPGGAMSGGFDKKQQSGVLTRRKQTAALKTEIAAINKGLQHTESQIAEVENSLQACANDVLAQEEKLKNLDLSLGLKENEIALLAQQTDAVRQAEKGLSDELDALEQKRRERSAALTAALEKLGECQEQERSLRVELAQLSGLLSAREEEKRSLREQYTECRVRVASLQKQYEHFQQELERLAGEQEQLEKRRRQKEAEIRGQKTLRLDMDSTIEASKEETTALEKERSDLLKVLVNREEDLKAKTTAFREETEQLRQMEKSLTSLERKQARLEVEKGRVEVEMQSALDRLRESWELEFDQAQKLANPLEDKKAAQAEIRHLKEQITELGNVNLGAIDEHNRVAERVEFLTAQQEDLREGEKDLLRIIKEIDSRMGEKFAHSFAIINEQFSVVFKELFGGGRAHLRLTDPDHPLEAGVEIVAQPPGKKLQHMSLLSGGEKTLTAIALLFAFLKFRPTPFCILDEIEAALDEANLNRFTDFLRTYSEQTQFILISHRKRTMEQADILYGVTMEESGVSKLISVRLRDADKQVSDASA